MYTTLYIHHYTTLGTPSVPTRQCTDVCSACGDGERVPWAQDGRNPWVRASLASQEPESVRERGGLCAELFRSSREKNSNDRIDEGSLPMYSP